MTPAASSRYSLDALAQFLIDDPDRAVDFGVGHAELVRDQLHEKVDALDERGAAGDRTGCRRGPENTFRRLGLFLERYLIAGIGAEALGDSIDVLIDRLRETDVAMNGIADRPRLVRRDAAVVARQ